MKVLKYSLFERNDIDIINSVNDLYNKLSECISEKSNLKNVFVSDGELYIELNYQIPLLICFSKKNKNHSLGEVEIGDNNSSKIMQCLWIPMMKKLKNIPLQQITYQNIIDNFHMDESSLKHEMTHMYDIIKHRRKGRLGSKAPEEYDEKEYIEYFNIDLERNAYFIQSSILVDNLLKEGHLYILKNFETFMKYMKMEFGYFFFENLNKKNKKKYMSRAYSLYEDFKKKYLNK